MKLLLILALVHCAMARFSNYFCNQQALICVTPYYEERQVAKSRWNSARRPEKRDRKRLIRVEKQAMSDQLVACNSPNAVKEEVRTCRKRVRRASKLAVEVINQDSKERLNPEFNTWRDVRGQHQLNLWECRAQKCECRYGFQGKEYNRHCRKYNN